MAKQIPAACQAKLDALLSEYQASADMGWAEYHAKRNRLLREDGRDANGYPFTSWVIVRKSDGAPIMETFNASVVAKVNAAAYEAVPIARYLGELNARIRGEAIEEVKTACANRRQSDRICTCGPVNCCRTVFTPWVELA